MLGWLAQIVLSILVVAICLMLMDRLEFGITVNSFGGAVFAAISIAMLDFLLWLVVGALNLGWGVAVEGLAAVVIAWLVAALVLYFVAKMRAGIEIKSFTTALIGAVVLALLVAGVQWVVGLFV